MRLVGALIAAVLLFAGCGEGNDSTKSKSEAAGDPSPSATTSENASGSMSDDCELAALTWMRAAKDAIGDAIFEVPFDDPTARDAPTDQIEVYCDGALHLKVTEANYELALLNTWLTVCKNVPQNCDQTKNEKQRQKADGIVNEVDALVKASS